MSTETKQETQSPGQKQFRSLYHPAAVVTGATGGIGQVIARRLTEAGWSVCALGTNEDNLKRVVTDLEFAQGGHAAFSPPPPDILSYVLDVTDEPTRTKVFNTIRLLWGKIDLLVCAHGASPNPTPFGDISISEYRRVTDIDVWGTAGICQEVIPIMVRQGGGSIVLISSFHVRGTYPKRSLYAMAKSAVSSLTRSLCVEYAKHEININCIAPGQVEGERSRNIASKGEEREALEGWKDRMPSGKLVKAEDISTMVQALAKCQSINGQTIYIDGGATASLWYKKH